jgi:hypothetical protein
MVNVFGELWRKGAPNWESVLAHPQAQLHLYGKAEARAGRKMGHVLLLDEDINRSLRVVATLFPASDPVGRQGETQSEEGTCDPDGHDPRLFDASRPALPPTGSHHEMH